MEKDQKTLESRIFFEVKKEDGKVLKAFPLPVGPYTFRELLEQSKLYGLKIADLDQASRIFMAARRGYLPSRGSNNHNLSATANILGALRTETILTNHLLAYEKEIKGNSLFGTRPKVRLYNEVYESNGRLDGKVTSLPNSLPQGDQSYSDLRKNPLLRAIIGLEGASNFANFSKHYNLGTNFSFNGVESSSSVDVLGLKVLRTLNGKLLTLKGFDMEKTKGYAILIKEE